MVYLPLFTYTYHKNQPNVGKYTIHGWYGYWFSCDNLSQVGPSLLFAVSTVELKLWLKLFLLVGFEPCQ